MKKIKIDLKKKKENTIKSLKEVEKFLKDIKNIGKYATIYNLFKK